MKILGIAMVTDWFFETGGVEKHAQSLANYLSIEGHEVCVITNYMCNGYSYDYNFKVNKLKGIPLKRWNIVLGVKPIMELKKALKGFDIVHGHSVFSP